LQASKELPDEDQKPVAKPKETKPEKKNKKKEKKIKKKNKKNKGGDDADLSKIDEENESESVSETKESGQSVDNSTAEKTNDEVCLGLRLYSVFVFFVQISRSAIHVWSYSSAYCFQVVARNYHIFFNYRYYIIYFFI